MTTELVEFRGGTVVIIGTSSDPGRLSPRTARLLAVADVILHDELVPQSVLGLCRRDATLYFVGHLAGRAEPTQSEIDCQLLHYARMGLRVIRLTGGGARVFSCDESVALERHGIEFYIINEPALDAEGASA